MVPDRLILCTLNDVIFGTRIVHWECVLNHLCTPLREIPISHIFALLKHICFSMIWDLMNSDFEKVWNSQTFLVYVIFAKMEFARARIFFESALKLLAHHRVFLWFVKNGTLTNHSKSRGSVWIRPQRPQTALNFALKPPSNALKVYSIISCMIVESLISYGADIESIDRDL